MATPAVINTAAVATGTSSSPASNSVTATAGNTLFFIVMLSTDRTVNSVSDTQSNTGWTETVSVSDGTRRVAIWRCTNCAAGATTVTGSLSGSAGFVVGLIEASNVSITTPDDTSDSLTTAAGAATTIFAAPSGAIDTTTDIIAICACRGSGTSNGLAASGTWVKAYPSGTTGSYFVGYKTSATALTDDRGGHTRTSDSSAVQYAIASYKADAAATGGMVHKRQRAGSTLVRM